MANPQDIRSQVLGLARRKGVFTTREILDALRRPVSRQYVTGILRGLVDEGILVRAGTTRGATYAVASKAERLRPVLRRRLQNRRLSEDEVFDRLRARAVFVDRLPANVREIYAYGFLEMLNNAIEHSRSRIIDVALMKDNGTVSFEVSDAGIGVFRNVMRSRGLASELEAIQDLLKGKTTTAPARHSGEGIFFTSRAADEFVLESYRYRLRVDNTINDYFIERMPRSRKGTRVRFRIASGTSRTLAEVFRTYAVDPREPAFDRSEVRVRLYTLGTRFVSRSQARRLLAGLEKFRSVVLDFAGVDTVGQGFADEVFRVFQQRRPEVRLSPVNMSEIVRFMVERAGA